MKMNGRLDYVTMWQALTRTWNHCNPSANDLGSTPVQPEHQPGHLPHQVCPQCRSQQGGKFTQPWPTSMLARSWSRRNCLTPICPRLSFRHSHEPNNYPNSIWPQHWFHPVDLSQKPILPSRLSDPRADIDLKSRPSTDPYPWAIYIDAFVLYGLFSPLQPVLLFPSSSHYFDKNVA